MTQDQEGANPGVRAYQRGVAAKKRESVITSARVLFLERGYAGASVAMIARGAGVSLATLYKHFPTKIDVFTAVAVELRQEIMDALYEGAPQAWAELPLEDAMLDFGHRYACALQRPDVLGTLRLMFAAAPEFPELAHAFYEHVKGPLFAPLFLRLTRVHAEGRVRDADLVRVTRQFLGLIEASVVWRGLLQPGEEIEPEHVEDVVSDAVRLVLSYYLVESR